MKYIIITGASKGIGRAAALQFAKKGTHLFLSARSSLEDLVPLIEEKGATVSVFQADLSISGEADKMMEAAEQEISRDNPKEAVLINNAGMVDPVGPSTSYRSGDVSRHMELNLSAPIVCAAHFMRSLEENKGLKTIINISSGAAHSTIFGWSAYSSSKAGLEQFTKTAAMEQQDTSYPVSVYAFSPGIVDTPMQESIRSVSKDNFRDLEQFKSYKKEGMLLPPEKVAEALERLLEKLPSNGSSVSVNSYM